MTDVAECMTRLSDAVKAAQALEELVNSVARNKKVSIVGYGFLIRQRRLAQAIEKLGTESAYEGRMLLRSMIEIHINYAWIRLRSSDRRANRFLRFEPMERLKLLDEIKSIMPESDYKAASKRWQKLRSKTRHLFRSRRRGKLTWDKNWAGRALDARLVEVMKKEKPNNWDRFLYGIYRWASSAVHGGIISLGEVLEITGIGLRAKAQPEADPTAQLVAACLMLVGTVQALAQDLSVLDMMEPHLTDVTNYLQTLKAPKTGAA